MAGRGRARVWAVLAVPLLTMVWCFAVLWLLLDVLATSLLVSADAGQVGTAGADQRRHASSASLWLVVTAVAGLAVIAVVAFCGRLPRTGWVYVAATVVVGVLAASPAALAPREGDSPAAPSPGPSQCIERSGGDTRCPGG